MSSVTAAEIQGPRGLAPAGGRPVEAQAPAAEAQAPAAEGAITFGDLLDVINPLQHIPVLSSIYRGLTGGTISQGARLAGDTLFGGPLGFLSSIVNTIVEGTTGKDIGGQVLALFQGSPAGSPQNPMVADAAAKLPSALVADSGAAASGGENELAEAGEDDVEETQLFSAARRESARRAADYAGSETAPSGAVAAEGGWFSDVMLTALDRYEAAAKLRAGDSAGRNLNGTF
jgi:hypothetical protein